MDQVVPAFEWLHLQFAQMDTLQQSTASVCAVCFVYSIALAAFRHSVYEDHGYADTASELFKYGFNLFVAFRYVDMASPEREVLYVCLGLVTILLTIKSYEKYVSGRVNPRRDLTGKVWIVTGSNTGIGFETALQLATMGATVVLACRSMDKAETARQEILAELARRSSGGDYSSLAPRVIVLKLDLCDFDSVTSFAKAFLALRLPLHGLINNAGAAFDKRQATSGGMEATLQSNHLSHYLLTRLLLPALEKTRGRVVNVASSVHNGARGMRWDDLFFAQPGAYSMFPCYDQSKLANLLFTRELNRRLQQKKLQCKERGQGSGVVVVAIHPGCVRTEFTKNMSPILVIGNMLAAPIMCTLMKTRTQGAYSTLHAALAPSTPTGEGDSGTDCLPVLGGGVYYHGEPYRNVSKEARDDAAAAKLWEVSAELTLAEKRIVEVWGEGASVPEGVGNGNSDNGSKGKGKGNGKPRAATPVKAPEAAAATPEPERKTSTPSSKRKSAAASPARTRKTGQSPAKKQAGTTATPKKSPSRKSRSSTPTAAGSGRKSRTK